MFKNGDLVIITNKMSKQYGKLYTVIRSYLVVEKCKSIPTYDLHIYNFSNADELQRYYETKVPESDIQLVNMDSTDILTI